MVINESLPHGGTVPEQSVKPRKTISRRNLLIGAGVGGAGLLAATGLAALNKFGSDSVGDQVPQGGGESSANPEGPSVLGGGTVAETTPTPEVKKEPTTLREWADKQGIKIGMQGTDAQIKADSKYAQLLSQEFNLAVVGGPLNWEGPGSQQGFTQALRPSREVFDFTAGDVVVKFARKNNMEVQAHHLVWGQFLPKWLTEGNFSKDELSALLHEHITKVVGHYASPERKVDKWSVVNEPTAPKMGWGSPQLRFWYDKLGYDFVNENAFRWAREADPSAKLFLNESPYYHASGESVTRTIINETHSTVKKLLSKGAPIDAVGLQMHLLATNLPSVDSFVRDIKLFQELGVDVYVTEFDVNMTGVPGTTSEREQAQKNIYKPFFDAYLKAGGKSFAMFGTTDKYSWYNSQGLSDADATPFDRSYNKKPAYFAIQEVLQDSPPSKG